MSITHEDLRTILTRPIAFHRLFAAVGGSVGAGVFLSQLYYWSERTTDPDGWVYKTAPDWYEETMLGRRELDTVRKALRDKGIIVEKLAGVPATVHYRIAWDTLFSELKAAAQEHRERLEQRAANQFGGKRQSGLAVEPDRTKAPNQFGGKRQTIDQRVRSETTAESTTKTPARTLAKSIVTPEKPVVVVSSVDAVEEEETKPATDVDLDTTVDALASEFGLTGKQRDATRAYAVRNGLERVQEVAEIVRSKPRDNLAAAFMAGIRDHWQKPKSTVAKKVARKVPPPAPVAEPVEAIDWEALRRRWAAATDAQREAWVPYDSVKVRLTRDRYRTNPGALVLGAARSALEAVQGKP